MEHKLDDLAARAKSPYGVGVSRNGKVHFVTLHGTPAIECDDAAHAQRTYQTLVDRWLRSRGVQP